MCNCLKRKSDIEFMAKLCTCKKHKMHCCFAHYTGYPYATNGKDYEKHIKIT